LTVRPGITDWASIWNSDEGSLLAGVEDPDRAYLELIRPTKLKLQFEVCPGAVIRYGYENHPVHVVCYRSA
jgi:hypothetical protein